MDDRSNLPTTSRQRPKLLTDEEIQKLLLESDVDESDDSEEEIQLALSEDSDGDDEILPIQDIDNDEIPSSQQPKEHRKIWQRKCFPSKLDCETEDLVGLSPLQPLSPFSYFSHYFTNDFWKLTSEQTNLYSVQKKGRSIKTNEKEIKGFVGIHLVMGVFSIPQARMYWSKKFSLIPLVTNAMQRDRFFLLRSNLHFADSVIHSSDTEDRLWRVRPLLNVVRNACLKIPRPKFCSIDEQMIPFVGRCDFRQYLPSKPNPWGIKNFVLASSDGVVLDFLLYTGKNTVPVQDMKELGLGGAVVKKLTESVPINESRVIFTDRYFTGVKIVEYLLSKGILCTGTVMANRIGEVANKMHAVKDSAMKRGEWIEFTRSDDKIVVLKWKDKKCVHMMSTACGSEPSDTCERWCKDEKAKVPVSRPAIIRMYNAHMGGIDLNDRFIACYRTSMRTRKWPIRVFAHFLDLVTVNSWVLYMRDCRSSNIPKRDQMSLLEFRLYIAEVLIKCETEKPTAGRPRKSEQSSNETTAKKRRRIISIPKNEVRYDGVEHWPQAVTGVNQSRCRMEGCKGKSRVKCVKCNVFLCLQNNDCFIKFHTK